ncbi:uncharacterized protein [Primulina eburnea]|uniref:uncharacterized protein n=1 Tax=Primulina eburnea TaxID=1245227 RepID=UPI003C6C0B82
MKLLKARMLLNLIILKMLILIHMVRRKGNIHLRWNATYFMLSTSLEFKDVFPRYQQRDSTYNSLPSDEDWEKVLVVCSFLEEFKEVTHVISGMEKIGSTKPSRLRKQRCARGRATSRAAARTYMQDEK